MQDRWVWEREREGVGDRKERKKEREKERVEVLYHKCVVYSCTCIWILC